MKYFIYHFWVSVCVCVCFNILTFGFRVSVYVSWRRRVRKTLYDLYNPYFLPVMVKFMRKMKGRFVIGMHLIIIECISEPNSNNNYEFIEQNYTFFNLLTPSLWSWNRFWSSRLSDGWNYRLYRCHNVSLILKHKRYIIVIYMRNIIDTSQQHTDHELMTDHFTFLCA